jgi:8-oxo-dGTP pyrophosphatase MutT (NUDIX family)
MAYIDSFVASRLIRNMSKSVNESWYKRPPKVPDRTSAGGVVVRRENDKILIALVNEGEIKDYILPKGKVEKGETLEEAAVREIGEEAGFKSLKLHGFLGQESRLNYTKDKWITTHYFLFSSDEKNPVPTDTRHEYQTLWFPIDKLPEMFWPEQKRLVEANIEKIKKSV